MGNQNLFNYMSSEHGISLTPSEMDSIKQAIEKDKAEAKDDVLTEIERLISSTTERREALLKEYSTIRSASQRNYSASLITECMLMITKLEWFKKVYKA